MAFRQIVSIAVFALFSISCGKSLTVEVTNPVDVARHPELVSVPYIQIEEGLSLSDDERFVIKDRRGEELPYQITGDSTVIFPVRMEAGCRSIFKISKGTPAAYQTKVCGRYEPLKDGDIAWENDLVGFRMYGHKLDVASGYDLFAKRGTDQPVLESFYVNERYDSKAWERYYELEKTDPEAAFRFKMDTLSYHVDRGFGMDCYGVGPTLGAGVAALVEDGRIVYPFCYDSYEILDNGPLRFRIRLTYPPFDIGTDKGVVETRIITLDLGSHLNRTEVSYSNLTSGKTIVAGIVLQDKEGQETANASEGYISYPAPTINVDTTQEVDNGTLFVGHSYPGTVKDAGTVYFSDEESASRGGTKGHIQSFSEYAPGDVFTYYWGFGWNHSDITSYQEWNKYLETVTVQVRNPLIVTLK